MEIHSNQKGSENTVAQSVQDLKQPEVKAEALRKVWAAYAGDLFAEERVKEAAERYEAVTQGFGQLLEQDGEVIKWLRPARNQFHIYYDRNSKRYEPDFVAETATAIYMVETKKAGDLDTDAVQKKKTAALNYCAAAAYTAATGGKPWIYLLIPHDAVMLNMSQLGLAAKHTQRK